MATSFASIGLHPWHVKKDSLDVDINLIELNANSSNVVAIGEAGLDKTIQTDIAIQLEAFHRQIDISISSDKPMIMHCVRAYNELIKIRKDRMIKQPWVFHWFNASEQTAQQLIRSGCYLSFGHMLFHETSKAFKTFSSIPVNSLFFETDDASVSIVEVYAKAAMVKGISLPALQAQIERNFNNCFQMSLC